MMNRKLLALLFLLSLNSGCSIMDRSDRFGAGFEFELGGLIGYVVSIKLKADIGFSKTFVEECIHEKWTGIACRGTTDPPYL